MQSDYQKYDGHQNLSVQVEPMVSFTEKTLNGIYRSLDIQRETIQIIAQLSERLFGQEPESTAKDGPVPVPAGKADETDCALREAIRYASRIREMASDLSSRI